MVFKAWSITSRGRFSPNRSAKIPELKTSWCLISRAMRTDALVDHGGFLLQAAIHWSRSSLRTPAVCYTVSWPSFTSIWIDSHPIACCFFFLLLVVLCGIFKCASWVVYLVATIAASRWTNQCLRCCCVSRGGASLKEPVVWLDSASISTGWSISGAMTCCYGMVRKMITKRSGKSWRLHSQLRVKMEQVTANLHLQFKGNPAVYSSTANSCRGFQ